MQEAQESVSHAPPGRVWARIFEFERSSLSLWLAVFPEDIEHIGSSAVPGLVADDVMDIMIGVEAFPPPAKFLRRIAGLGYAPVKRPVVPDQFEFRLQGQPRIELHVVKKGASHWNNNIGLRDFLRTNAAARENFQWPRNGGPTAVPEAAAVALPDEAANTEWTGR